MTQNETVQKGIQGKKEDSAQEKTSQVHRQHEELNNCAWQTQVILKSDTIDFELNP